MSPGLSFGDLAERVAENTHNSGGGMVEIGGEQIVIRADSRVTSLEEIQAKLPPGIRVRTLYDGGDLVNRTIGTVERNLAEGALLVVVVLFLLLGHGRAALIVALAIPLSMLFATTGMARSGLSGNLMSLGAIGFGTHH